MADYLTHDHPRARPAGCAGVGPVEPTQGNTATQGSGQGCAPCDGTGLVGADRLFDVCAAHPLTRFGDCAATSEPTGQGGAQAPRGHDRTRATSSADVK